MIYIKLYIVISFINVRMFVRIGWMTLELNLRLHWPKAILSSHFQVHQARLRNLLVQLFCGLGLIFYQQTISRTWVDIMFQVTIDSMKLSGT